MKMSSLQKLRIIDHEFCLCEYGLWHFPFTAELSFASWARFSGILAARGNIITAGRLLNIVFTRL
jgi:hypothetical protein